MTKAEELLNPTQDIREAQHAGYIVAHHIREGGFQRSLALTAGLSSVIAGMEVAYEHYRGSYGQRIMYTPVACSGALLLAGVSAAFSRKAARTLLPTVSAITLVDCGIGFIFHVRGIQRKPGGWRLPVFNIVMGPPVFAPLLFGTSAYLGLVASFLRREESSPAPQAMPPSAPWTKLLPRKLRGEEITLVQEVREGKFQKHLAAATAASAFFSGIEALYSHYKNNFKYKAQWSPIVIAGLLIGAAVGSFWSPRVAKKLLPAASALAIADGGVGFFYHARGVKRRPGGLKRLYNIMYGPPIFAPLLFAACGFLGILASMFRREQ